MKSKIKLYLKTSVSSKGTDENIISSGTQTSNNTLIWLEVVWAQFLQCTRTKRGIACQAREWETLTRN